MKTAIAVLYVTLALSLVGTGLFVYDQHQKKQHLQADNEETFIDVYMPPEYEITEAIDYIDIRMSSQAEPGMLQGVMSCASCAKNAYTGFKSCPAAYAQDGLNPWTDFKCIQAILKLPSSCKNCFCSIAHHYHRRIRGC